MSNHLSPLVRRSPLLPGESLPSLLVRLAKLNHYSSPAIIRRVCTEGRDKDIVERPTKPATYEHLAALTRLDPTELYNATEHRFLDVIALSDDDCRTLTLPGGQAVLVGNTSLIRKHTWSNSDAQFCPACLAEAAYHRIGWMPVAVAACLRHQCLLIQGCPGCEKSLTIWDILANQCPRCHFELTGASTVSTAKDEFGMVVQAIIQSWLGLTPPVKGDYGLPKEPPPSLYRLLDGLRWAVMGIRSDWNYLYRPPTVTSTSFPRFNRGGLNPAKAYALYATAFKGTLNWPQGFYDFLDAYKRRDGREPNGQVVRDLGIIYFIWLEKRWQLLQFVQEAFNQYLLDNYALTPSLMHLHRIENNTIFRARFPYITEAEAARALGTNGRMIQRLIASGLLVTHQQVEKDALSQRFTLVRRAEVEALQQKWQGGIPMNEVTQLLRMSRR